MRSAAFVFPAVKGIQAQREYYVSMVPLEVIAKIFQFADEELPPEVRSQRILNKTRIPEIRDSIIEDGGYAMLNKLESYITQHEGSSIFIRLSTKDSESKSKRAVLAIVQVPYSAFSGWKKVTLMSAFFKDSQLYAVLSSANKAGCLKSDVNFKLEPEKNVRILEKNEKLISRRCAAATITYVYDNDSYISKRIYNKGVVYSVGSSLVNTINKDTIASFNICKNSKDIKQHESFNKYNSVLDLVRANRTHKLSSEPLTFEAQYFRKLQPALVYVTPLEFAIKMSLKYSLTISIRFILSSIIKIFILSIFIPLYYIQIIQKIDTIF